MDFVPLTLNSSSLTCSFYTLAAMECQKFHMVDSPMQGQFNADVPIGLSQVVPNQLHPIKLGISS